MKFEEGCIKGTLVKRYKRFLADVALPDGRVVVAHCANSGSMAGCAVPGSPVVLSPNTNPKAKLDWRWELVRTDRSWVGINTMHPNRIVAEAIAENKVQTLTGYKRLSREVKYGQNSRIDILLEDPGKCYVEVKNVTLARGDLALFPDAVTKRGLKHLSELSDMVKAGHRAVMFYLVQREDCTSFAPAGDIDPEYAAGLKDAVESGVEVLVFDCHVEPEGVALRRALPYRL